jgi:hypothetical protein
MKPFCSKLVKAKAFLFSKIYVGLAPIVKYKQSIVTLLPLI